MATIGIDLGGTKILAAVVDGGTIGAQVKQSTPTKGGPDAVVDALAGVVAELGGTDAVDGVGVGFPGPVHPTQDLVGPAPNLAGWDAPVPLAGRLSAAWGGATVTIENDVNAGTVGEHRLGAGRGVDHLLGVFVGTGVGGGLVLDGRLRRGPHGLAAELGHTAVRPGGRRCGCGQRGHLEAYAGRAGLEHEARRRAEQGERTALVDLAGDRRMKSSVFAKALDRGDELAQRLLDEAVEALGVALASAAALVDLEMVVVGGGLADRLGPPFVEQVADATRRRLFGVSELRIVPAELGDDAGALGAALLFDA